MPDIDFHDPEFVKRYIKRNAKLFKIMRGEIKRICKDIDLTGKKVLETGCGTGYIALELARIYPGAVITGTDFSQAFIDYANDRKTEESLTNVTFEKADAEALPYGDNSFDAVISYFTVHWVSNPIAMLREADRVLKPGGLLLAGDTRYRLLLSFAPGFKTALTRKKALELLKEAGIRPHMFSSGFWYWRIDTLQDFANAG